MCAYQRFAESMKNNELRQPSGVESVLQSTPPFAAPPTCIFTKQNSGAGKVQDTLLLLNFGRTANDVLVLTSIPKRASPVAQMVENLPAVQETWVGSLGWEDPRAWQSTPAFLPGKSQLRTHSLCPFCLSLVTPFRPTGPKVVAARHK